MLNLFQHLDPKIRCTLKNKNPLVAARPSFRFFVEDSVMLNLFQHPGGPYENITSRHSELDSESRSLVDVSNELTSSPFRKRSSSYNLHFGTCNRSFLRTENRLTINQFLLFFRTPYLLPRITFLISPDPGSSPG